MANACNNVDRVELARRLRAAYIQSGLAFCSDPSSVAKIAVMKIVIEPQQELMGSAIKLAGVGWDKEQGSLVAFAASQGQPRHRRYRVEEVYDLVQERRFLNTIYRLSASADVWQVLPVANRTSEMRCLAFRLLSFSGCFVHLHLVMPASRYPLSTFRLALESMRSGNMSHMAEGLLAESPCCLGPLDTKCGRPLLRQSFDSGSSGGCRNSGHPLGGGQCAPGGKAQLCARPCH